MDGYFFYLTTRLEKIKTGGSKDVDSYMKEMKAWEFWRAGLAEMLGTLLFVFVGCSSILPMSFVTFEAAQIVRVAFTFGLMIAVLIQMFGHVSGGHFNPAVSIAMAVNLTISPARALLYVVSQGCGALLGALILKGVTPSALHSNLGATTLNGALDGGQGFGCECIYTFILIFSIMGTTDGNRPLFGSPALGIGFTVTVLHLGGIPFTGASMNPARSLGAAVISSIYDNHWVYWVGPIVGGCLASLAYTFIFNPYRGALSTEDAAAQMIKDDGLVVVPKTLLQSADKDKAVEEVVSKL